jgi:hypothetical protein
MTSMTDREAYGLLVLIEQMQRQGAPEEEIEEAVREASSRQRPIRYRLPRRPSRFELAVRRHR